MTTLKRVVEQVGRFEAHHLPSGETVYFEPERHAYFGELKQKKNGGWSYVQSSRLTGVSTPGKCLDTNVDPLLYWAAKLDQVGIADLYNQSCANGGDVSWLSSQESISRMLREHGLTWADVRDRTATRGTNVHEQILLALAQEQRPPSLSRLTDEERGYGQAALRWWRDRKPEALFAEQVTASLDHRVAGQFDLLAMIDGERVLVDAKTREKGVARKGDHAQLAGYELCNQACGIGPSDRQVALILKPDGDYVEVDSVGTPEQFLASLDSYRAGSDLDKAIKAAEKAEAEGQGVIA